MTLGPRWLCIGASDAGASTLSNLLLQHPEVRRPTRNVGFGMANVLRDLPDPLADGGSGRGDLDAFRAWFTGPGAVGGCAPALLRRPWLARTLQRAAPDAQFVVVLRDPVARFAGRIRSTLEQERRTGQKRNRVSIRGLGVVALWDGMYASLLEPWSSARERVVVLQWEAIVSDPGAAAGAVLRRLGLEPVPVALDPAATAPGAADPDPDEPAGLREHLAAMYRPQAQRVADEWGIDLALWPGVSG